MKIDLPSDFCDEIDAEEQLINNIKGNDYMKHYNELLKTYYNVDMLEEIKKLHKGLNAIC